jgi:hypothetical protein
MCFALYSVSKMPKAAKEKDPNAPKRPQSAYFFFCGKARPALKKQQPELGFADLARELGRQWGEMDDSQKAPYTAQADADKVSA